VSSQMADENKALRKEIAELRRANEILKAAAIFFGAELDRPGRR
jgi:transposase